MKNTIIHYIKEELLSNQGDIDLYEDEDLLSSGLLDSISIMRLIQFIESTFDIAIPPEDMTIENFISVEAMETYLTTRKKESV